MITFNVITLFPTLFTDHLYNLPFKRAEDKVLAKYNVLNLRDYSIDKRGTVDDKTYGGGVGMVLMIEPIYKALENIPNKEKVIVLSPRGKTFTQDTARELAKCKNITFICGRYEGIDERVSQHLATDVISIGDYVLSGGELPALVIMEAVTRLIPGVLEKEEAAEIESFSNKDGKKNIEYPQYTRPEDFKGIKVPEVLLSGNHEKVKKWRDQNSTKQTA